MLAQEMKRIGEMFLAELYRQADGTNESVSTESICSAIGIDKNTIGSQVAQNLKLKDYISWVSFGSVNLTGKGLTEAESIMATTWDEDALLMLRTAIEMSGTTPNGMIISAHLEAALRDKITHPYNALEKYLLDEEFFESEFDEGVNVAPDGFAYISRLDNPTPDGERYYGRQDTTFNHYGDIHNNAGILSMGDHATNSIQNTQNNNPEFATALNAILEITKASGLSQDDQALIRGDLHQLQKLETMEKTPSVLARANGILTTISTSLGAIRNVHSSLSAIAEAFGLPWPE